MSRDIRVIIAGGRKFNDYDKLKECMNKWKKTLRLKEDDKVTVVCGCADGADTLGKKYADEIGWACEMFPANWNLLGKAAGILRNKEMAKFASEKEGYLVAFWNGESRGTKNMIDTAIQHGIPVTIYSYDDEEGNAIREYIGDIWGKFTDTLEEVFSEKVTEIQSEKVEKGESTELPFSGKNVDIKVEKI